MSKPAVLGFYLVALFLFLNASAGAQKSAPTPDEWMVRAKTVLAQTDGKLTVPGLKKPVTVWRDSSGVPHIYAENQNDLFFAQGFVAAQDRLWQMDMWRRTGRGELAEILGPSAIERDTVARLIRYRGDMKAEWNSYAPDTERICIAFVRGINAYIAQIGDRLPIEFQITGTKPGMWEPTDCLSRDETLGFALRIPEFAFTLPAMVPLYGEEKTSKLFALSPPVPPGSLTSDPAIVKAKVTPAIYGLLLSLGAPVTFPAMPQGSNNWVVSGKLTANGKPLLANDPHRTYELPSRRYIVHLVCPGWNVIGAAQPPVPGVQVGHNERVAFGLTIVNMDRADLFVEETDPADPTRYRVGKNWEKMRVEKTAIRVKGRTEPMTVELRWTRNGPVVYQDAKNGIAAVLRWVGSEPGTAAYLAALSLDRAKNAREFREYLKRWKAPDENFVFADVEGNIGWQVAGLAPKRKKSIGLLPVPGADGEYDWTGYLTQDEMPHQENPTSGVLATANNQPKGETADIGHNFAAPYRHDRIREVLDSPARKPFTVEDFVRLQTDNVSLPARELLACLKEVSPQTPRQREAHALLGAWDGIMARDSVAASVFALWMDKWDTAVLKSTVPDEVQKTMAVMPSTYYRRFTLQTLRDPSALGGTSARNALLLATLEETMSDLEKRFGPERSRWNWGAVHLTALKHPLANLVGPVFDMPAVGLGGDAYTVHANSGSFATGGSGATFRMITSVGDWDNAVALNAPGQSGQPGSPHYADLLTLWVEGRYFPLLFRREKIERAGSQKLILEPKP